MSPQTDTQNNVPEWFSPGYLRLLVPLEKDVEASHRARGVWNRYVAEVSFDFLRRSF